MDKLVRHRRRFDDNFKFSVVQELLISSCSQYSLCKKYSISDTVLRRWIRTFAPEYKSDFVGMGKKVLSESDEILALKLALRQKELELKKEKMRADFYQTMVDVAEEQFNIDIRKKAGTKR